MKAVPYSVLLALLWSFPSSASAQSVYYAVHVRGYGWDLGFSSNGGLAGTTGQKRQMEAITIFVEGLPSSCNIRYIAHLEDIGWRQGWRYGAFRSAPFAPNAIAGTTHESRRMEAISIQLYEIANGMLRPCPGWSVFYQVHVQDRDWLPVVRDGAITGTIGESKRMEAIRIWLHRQ
jgi:uncharacterized protein YjdB